LTSSYKSAPVMAPFNGIKAATLSVIFSSMSTPQMKRTRCSRRWFRPLLEVIDNLLP
jgi:hypothetical protein